MQGATKLYLEQVHPQLTKHELEIEDFISRAHDQLKALGIEYLKRAIQYGEEVIFGIRRVAEAPPSPGDPNNPVSYANSLLSRFRLPPISPYGSQVATDFYHILSSALQQQQPTKAGDDWSSVASKMLPQGLKGKDEKAEYMEAQKKRLQQVMAALDKEMAQLGQSGEDPSTTSAAGIVQAAAGDVQRSPSHVSLNGGDFDHVERNEAEGAGWWGGWGSWDKQTENLSEATPTTETPTTEIPTTEIPTAVETKNQTPMKNWPFFRPAQALELRRPCFFVFFSITSRIIEAIYWKTMCIKENGYELIWAGGFPLTFTGRKCLLFLLLVWEHVISVYVGFGLEIRLVPGWQDASRYTC